MQFSDTLKNKHFLVVDDYESMRTLVGDQLKKLGIRKITFASSGNQAIKKIQELKDSDPVQYILADLVMEDGDGVELVTHVRKVLLMKIPIIMVTSKAEVNHVLDAVRAGVSSYIVKPWTVEDLTKKIIEMDK